MNLSFPEILALVTVILNVAGIVWGAAKLDSASKYLEKIVGKLEDISIDHETRISRLEGGKRV